MPADPDQPRDPRPRDPSPGDPSPGDEGAPGAFGAFGFAAVALLAVLCCAAPALLTAGLLGAVGAWLASPWLIVAALALLGAVTVWRLRRRHTSPTAHDAAHPETTRSPPSPPADLPPAHPADPTQER